MMTEHLTQEDAIYATSASDGFNICERLRRMEIPTLVIVGDNDHTTPVREVERMHNLLPHSELVIVKDANHLIIVDHAKEFNEAVERFLNLAS